MTGLPHSWQRLLWEHDAAASEPRFSLRVLLSVAPATTTPLDLEGTMTFVSLTSSQDLTPYTHERAINCFTKP